MRDAPAQARAAPAALGAADRSAIGIPRQAEARASSHIRRLHPGAARPDAERVEVGLLPAMIGPRALRVDGRIAAA